MNTLIVINTLLLIAMLFCIWHLTDLIKNANKLIKESRDCAHNASSYTERASINVTALMNDFGKLLNNLKKEEKKLTNNHTELSVKLEGIVLGFRNVAKEINNYFTLFGANRDENVVEKNDNLEPSDSTDNNQEK